MTSIVYELNRVENELTVSPITAAVAANSEGEGGTSNGSA